MKEHTMKRKKPSAAVILFAITMVAYMAATLIFCYKTKPEVTKGEFPFSITYEYEGETKTLSGVLKCEFSSSSTIFTYHNRYWNEKIVYDNPENVEYPFLLKQDEESWLEVRENMSAGYFMGDPLYKDYYERQGMDGVAPYFVYEDYVNNIVLNEENQEEVLDSIGFKLIEATYADPIENSFSFAGIKYKADNITIFVAIMCVYLLLCLIFVRRDKEYSYSTLDKVGIALNFLLGIVAMPFIYFFCMFFSLVGSGMVLVDQIVYTMPPFAILCLALSVVFRRRGYSKPGFFIQFVGILPFVILFAVG